MSFKFSPLSGGLVQADPSAAFNPQGFSEPAQVRPQTHSHSGHGSHSGGNGGLLDSLLSRPNKVPELQRQFQAPSDLPVFLRGKNDKLVFGFMMGASAVCVSLIFVGMAQMSLGVGKKKN